MKDIRLDIKLVNIGFGNIISAGRIIAIVSPESAPIKRIIGEARIGDVDRCHLRAKDQGGDRYHSGHVILRRCNRKLLNTVFKPKKMPEQLILNNR